MDETRKRWITAGIILGTTTVGLTILSRRVPRDKWAETLSKIATDALTFLRGRYGENPSVQLIEQAVKRYEESGRETAVSRAFQEALGTTEEKA